MEYNYSVTDEKGSETQFRDISSIALKYLEKDGVYVFNSFEDFRAKLKSGCNVDVRRIDDVNEREQAIYKRLCNIKRPKPERRTGEFKKGDRVIQLMHANNETPEATVLDVIKQGGLIYLRHKHDSCDVGSDADTNFKLIKEVGEHEI